jgi:preprotein translocase subunit SecG
MTIVLVIIHVIVCFVLILVILLQAGRGQGLSGPTFGSGNVQSLFGTRANDFLTKATSVSAICFLLTCITLGYFETQKSKSLMDLRRPAAQLDMETIRKALEKVKAEQAAKAANTGTGAVQNAPETANVTPEQVPAAAANELAKVDKDAVGAASQPPADVVKTAAENSATAAPAATADVAKAAESKK